MAKQPGFFDLDERYEVLSRLGDPLRVLATEIPWERFRPTLEKALRQARGPRKSEAGRKPHDSVLMFKALVLQRLYKLSDFQCEYQIRDRLSFSRFLGLELGDTVPDEKTIWLFREHLTTTATIDRLFGDFDRFLEERGLRAQSGQIVDASLVNVPVQRNTRDQNRRIKQGDVPEEWTEAQRRQKDVDARWVKKNGRSEYGYKNHVNVDVKHKLVRCYTVTPANEHDSQAFEGLLDRRNRGRWVFGDKAYTGEEIEDAVAERGYVNRIHEKGTRDHPLSARQEEVNRKRSKIRARVEHVFGFQQNTMGAGFIRCIGLARARAAIGLNNLTYNLMRYLQLRRMAAQG